jgi:branched-chain amino acid transport system substrate-binding protein
VLFLCLLVAPNGNAQTSPDQYNDSGELVLGMSAAFTGPSSGLGIELYRGSMAYFEKVNRNGGVHGRKVVILPMDDGYNPTPAIENTLNFLHNPKVIALFNYVGTPTVTRVLPLLKLYSEKHKYLFFPFTGAQPQRQYPYDVYVFNLRASYAQETAGLVQHFLNVGRSRISVFYQADSYGRSGWDGVRHSLKAHDLQITSEATYARGAPFSSDFTQQVRIIAEGAPDAVVAVGAYAACAAFIRDARDAGLDIPIANLSFVGSENLLMLLDQAGKQNGKDYTRNLINSQVVPSYEDTSLPAVREYRELMDTLAPLPPAGFAPENYSPLPYSFTSFEGFFNAKVMVKVLENLGPRPALRDLALAAETMDSFDIGIDKPVHFSAIRHQGLDVIYYTTVEDGKFLPIEDWGVWAK